MLTIISILLLAVWNCFYVVFLYRYPDIVTEVGQKVTKKSFVIWSLYLACCIAFLWAYFLCVTRDYYEALMSYDERQALKAEEAMASPKMDAAPSSPKMEA